MKYALLALIILLLAILAGISSSKSAQVGLDRFVPCSSCSRNSVTPTPEEPKPTPTDFETPVCYKCATPTDDWVPTRNPSPPPPLWTLEPSPTETLAWNTNDR